MDEINKTSGAPQAPNPPAGWSSAADSGNTGSRPWAAEARPFGDTPTTPPPPPGAGADAGAGSESATTELPRADQSATTEHAAPYAAPVAQGGDSLQAPRKSKRGVVLVAGIVIGALVGGGSGAAVVSWLDDDTSAPASQESVGESPADGDGSVERATSLESVADVADLVQPSVVSIAVGNQFGAGTGSGIILSEAGEILTNNHVVEGARTVSVTFSDGTTAEAEVIQTDPRMDLAVIKAHDVSGLQPATLGSSDALAVGEQVVAVGSPLGLDGTVTTGIVSAMERPVTATGQVSQTTSFIDAIQTDAPINPGNSGGPLVNMAGEVIGVNSAIATDGSSSGSIGLGFAIPIDDAKDIVEQLRDGENPTHARLGVFVGATADGSMGSRIDEVESGSAAEEAGLQAGDVVTKIDDRLVVDSTELIAATLSYRPGDTVTITYERDGETHTTEVTLGSDAQST